MSYVALPGGAPMPFGIGVHNSQTSTMQASSGTLDAANEAEIFIGYVVTADGASHTIDTTGSSSLQWRSAASTFANAGTTVVVGLAAVDTANGPPARAVNATNVITFDVSRSMTGGGGGITTTAWQTHVPTAGTKTVANGDLVAFAVQMTARGGVDSVLVTYAQGTNDIHRPAATGYLGGVYTAQSGTPICVIVFSDGTLGWLYAADIFSSLTTRTWNSGSATKEYGQLYSLPFPCRINGLYGWLDPDADCDIVLYSDPLGGTPVAEKTISLDANVASIANGRQFSVLFPAAYDLPANTSIAAIYKPGGSNVSVYLKTIASATHRVTDMGGTSSYGVSRASGAFANANSSLDHYYIGLMLSAFDGGGGGGTGLPASRLQLGH